MKIKLLHTIAGSMGVLAPGVHDVDPVFAEGLRAVGAAEIIEPPAPQPIQTAELARPVTTDYRRRRRAKADGSPT